MTTNQNASTVYLVGAGPGDPGLITIAGAEILRRADILVYDFLANPKLVELAPPACQKIYAGKSASQHTLTQDQINQLLADKSREHPGRTIVRLKGGDPYVFGRGGEEAEFLHSHGIPFVEIPGITAGIAGPAYAGIPVTHRDWASTVTFITGHEKDESAATSSATESNPASSPAPIAGPNNAIDYAALAKLGGTLIFYMGVKSLPVITQKLIAAGLPAATPAAVVRWATHPHQRTVEGTLETIARRVQEAGITAPAITIIGHVVRLRSALNFFESRPLFGQTVIVTRTRHQASELAAGLSHLGAAVIECPTIEITPPADWTAIDAALLRMHQYHWIVFTSANGVQAAWQRLCHLQKDARTFAHAKIAAIGPATAAALQAIGIFPDLIPEKFIGEALAEALLAAAAPIPQKHFLLLRADIARPMLRDALLQAGACVDDLPLYQTVRPQQLAPQVLEALHADSVRWITFTSASTAENFFALVPPPLHEKVRGIHRLSIGPITTDALKKTGFRATLEATQHDIPGMLEALVQHSSGSRE